MLYIATILYFTPMRLKGENQMYDNWMVNVYIYYSNMVIPVCIYVQYNIYRHMSIDLSRKTHFVCNYI